MNAPVKADYLKELYEDRKARYADRDAQGQKVRDVLRNKLDTIFKDVLRPGDDPVVANLIIAAARTMSQRVGRMPRITAVPRDRDAGRNKKLAADRHTQALLNYAERMGLERTLYQAAYWQITHDATAFVVRPSSEYGIPIIECKDPLSMYAGSVWPHKPEVYDVLFATKMPAYQACRIYDIKHLISSDRGEKMKEVVIGEYFVPEGCVIALLEPTTAVIDFIAEPCPAKVVIGRGFSPDLSFHGQFDHVIGILKAQAKLNAIMMAHSWRLVFGETNITGEIISNQGQYAEGPGAVNVIQPFPGATSAGVQKSVNQMSQQSLELSQQLERGVRIAGGFPAQLSGEPVATIATGKGTEQLLTAVDDNTNYYQTVLGDALRRAFAVIPEMARNMGAEDADMFTTDTVLKLNYLSGSDPSETVRLLQMQGAGNLSSETIMARMPEIDDPQHEQQRTDSEALDKAVLQSITAQAQQVDPTTGQPMISVAQIAQIKKLRLAGDTLEAAVEQALAASPAEQMMGPPPDLGALLQGAPDFMMPLRQQRQARVATEQGPVPPEEKAAYAAARTQGQAEQVAMGGA